MNKRLTLAITAIAILVSGCSSVSDTRPEVLRKSEYYLEHGVDAYGNSDYVTAADFFNKALAHYRSIDNTHGILQSLINLAETAMATGNSSAVIRRLDEAQRVIEGSPNPQYLKRIQLMRAQVYWREHEKSRVLSLLEPLLPAFNEDETLDETPDLIALTAIIVRTDIAFAELNENPETASRWLLRLQRAVDRNSDTTPLHNARLNRFKALMAYRNGNTDAALELLDKTLAEYRSAAIRPAIAATLTETAKLYMQQQQWSQAEDRLQRALYIRVWILDRVGSRETLSLLSAVYQEMGDEKRAALSQHYAESIRTGGSTWSGLKNDLLQVP